MKAAILAHVACLQERFDFVKSQNISALKLSQTMLLHVVPGKIHILVKRWIERFSL